MRVIGCNTLDDDAIVKWAKFHKFCFDVFVRISISRVPGDIFWPLLPLSIQPELGVVPVV